MGEQCYIATCGVCEAYIAGLMADNDDSEIGWHMRKWLGANLKVELSDLEGIKSKKVGCRCLCEGKLLHEFTETKANE